MQSSTSRAVSVGLLLALIANVGEAQELAGSFDQLKVLVKAGDSVLVTDGAGRQVRGTIADVSSSSLALKVGGDRRTFLERDVAAIHQRRPDSLANGAKWGFISGACLGVLSGIVLASEYENGGGALIPLLALTYGGLGAGAGTGIDAMVSGNQVIYARRASAAKVSLHPILAPGRQRIGAAITVAR